MPRKRTDDYGVADLSVADLEKRMADLERQRTEVKAEMKAVSQELAHRHNEPRLEALAANLSDDDLARLAELRQRVQAEGVASGEAVGEPGA